MVVGSFASSLHGVPRTTHDLDIVIDPSREALDKFLEQVDLERYYVDADVARDALARRSLFNMIEMSTGWKLDLIVRKDRPFSIAELARRTRQLIADVEVPTATAEDTVISKLEWSKDGGSERQLGDVVGILKKTLTLDRDYIERWVMMLGLQDPWQRALATV